MRPEDILLPTASGVCCKIGSFHIDPVRPVDKAVITHGHSDHARAGHGAVLATQETLDLMRLRYGEKFAGATQAIRYGETVSLGGARISFHPAGHVLGSAQIAVECNGLRVVASGDYKNVPDPTCAGFELVPCDVFITEATFGLPVFRHPPAAEEIGRLLRSVAQFPERSHVVGAYALGKAQRVMRLLRDAGYDRPIYIHGALATLSDYYQSRGIDLGRIEPATVEKGSKGDFAGAVIVGPPTAFADRWARRFPDPIACFASGWMRIRGTRRRRAVDRGFVLSDHADWPGLLGAIRATGAERVWVTHGYVGVLVRWLQEQGLDARALQTQFEGERDDAADEVPEEVEA
jgi:putative mRNA 3-end processing factor